MDKTLHFVFGIFGNIFALFLYLAPVVTFKRVVKKKSTEQFSGMPYVLTLLNNLIAIWYGLPFVSANNLLLSTVNAAGATLQSIYLIIFLTYAPQKEKGKILVLLAIELVFFAAVVCVSLFALHGGGRRLVCGVLTDVFAIIMYASPMAIIRLVIRTKSVEFMPFLLSLCVFLCGTSWLLFGLLEKDPFLTIPSAFGCGLGTVQLILYGVYRNNKGEIKNPRTGDRQSESMEKPSNGVQSHDDEQV